jgi:hypothetical protein
MKKIIGISLFLFFGMASVTHAQSTVKKAGHEVKTGAKKVGNKTAEVASKGKSRIVDKRVKDKTGPNGETIYVDDNTKYYWVDKKGHKEYIASSRLKTKVSE